jgi:hypothetical protein
MEPQGSLPIHKNSSPVRILSHIEPVHAPPSNLSKINLNITLPSVPESSKWSPSLKFSRQNPYAPILSPIRPTCPARLSLLDLISRMISGKECRTQSCHHHCRNVQTGAGFHSKGSRFVYWRGKAPRPQVDSLSDSSAEVPPWVLPWRGEEQFYLCHIFRKLSWWGIKCSRMWTSCRLASGSTFRNNVFSAVRQHSDTASRPRRRESSVTPLWEPQISLWPFLLKMGA